MRRHLTLSLLVGEEVLRFFSSTSILLQVVTVLIFSGLTLSGNAEAQELMYQISSTDPDFSIAILPDTQYYNSTYKWVFLDQVNWIVEHQADLRIKAVIGLGDITDGGGYPIDSSGTITGVCNVAPPSNWQTQWKNAQAALSVLTNHGIYYQATIGNHDYDCQADRPQPRGTSNYFHYLGPNLIQPTAYILDSFGNRTPNFYKFITIGSRTYLILSLEFFPRQFVIDAADNLISGFAGPVILVTHAYLSHDGSGPTFGSASPAGSAYPLCSGFPSVYNCRRDSLISYNPEGGGTDGISLWYKLIATHPNILMVLSGHVRNPKPGNYPDIPNYNGVGYVNCALQSWTTLCSNPYRPIQILSDYQGQGNDGYFGYGYLRILTVSPSRKKVSVFSYSPSIAKSPEKFPAGIPAYRTDSYNNYSVNFPPTFGGPDREITYITTPRDGSHVPLTFGISAIARGPDNSSHMQIYVDGKKYAEYPGVAQLPAGTQITLTTTGTHRVTVRTYDYSRSIWINSSIYVTNP
ncbi:MAG: metallophosphoesterase [Acidobacteriaceae bacterium]